MIMNQDIFGVMIAENNYGNIGNQIDFQLVPIRSYQLNQNCLKIFNAIYLQRM